MGRFDQLFADGGRIESGELHAEHHTADNRRGEQGIEPRAGGFFMHAMDHRVGEQRPAFEQAADHDHVELLVLNIHLLDHRQHRFTQLAAQPGNALDRYRVTLFRHAENHRRCGG